MKIGSLNQFSKFENCFIGQIDRCVEMIQIGRLFVSPEDPCLQVVTRLLHLIHAFKYGRRSVTEKVHLRDVIPEWLGNVGHLNLSAFFLPEGIRNTFSAQSKTVAKGLHLPQNDKGEAPRGVVVFLLLLPLLGQSLMRGDLVRRIDCAGGKKSLCPRRSRRPPAQRLAEQFKRIAIERICHVRPLSLLEVGA